MAESGALAKAARSTAAHVAFALVAMGAWAAFANRDHGLGAAALAFAVQGGLSGLITLVLKRWLEWSFARLQGLAARAAPPLASCATIAAVLWAAHALAGTPEILATVAVPWSVSTLYAFVYTATLGRQGP